jgi:hypothetical protein
MRMLQISDSHVGITKRAAIRRMLEEASSEQFDVIVHCGDYCGGAKGWRSVRETVKLIREIFPDTPFLSVIGNHDYYYRPSGRKGRPSLAGFTENLERIRDAFKEHNVHFLDEDGPWSHHDFPTIKVIGVSGWYNNPNPPTNDRNFLPVGLEGDTNRYLLKKAEWQLDQHLQALSFNKGADTLVFVSHFPVINTGNDYKGAFEQFSWSERIGEYLQADYGCRYFLNGHAHQLHAGPLRYECGSDYYRPKYQIITVV